MASKTVTLLSSSLRQMRPRVPRAATNLQSSLLRIPSSPSIAPIANSIRAAHSIPRPPPVTPREPQDSSSAAEKPKSEGERPSVPLGKNTPYYQLTFTCVPCGHRSHHNISKQGYHTGSTLITCPECRNRHIISDHLGIFGKDGLTIEDIMREKGQLVKRGSLGEDSNIEFWPDEKESDQTEEDKETK